MDKLELKHIAPYLPYGLKVKILNGEFIGKLYDISSYGKITLVDPNSGVTTPLSLSQCLPILYPLSSLTKSIWHEGREFIPLIELAEIEGTVDTSDKNPKLASSNNGWIVGFNIENDDYDNTDVFGFDLIFGFAHHYRPSKKIGMVLNQIDLWQKLYEWKIDVWNLTEKGLAIDVTTLDDNPYKEGGSHEG